MRRPALSSSRRYRTRRSRYDIATEFYRMATSLKTAHFGEQLDRGEVAADLPGQQVNPRTHCHSSWSLGCVYTVVVRGLARPTLSSAWIASSGFADEADDHAADLHGPALQDDRLRE